MNQQLATLVTLVVATVSGFAIWQDDVHAAVTVPPAAVEDASCAPAPVVRAGTPWFVAALRSCRAGGLAIDLRHTEHSVSLQITWGQGSQSASDRAR